MPFPDVKLNDGNKIPSIAFGSGTALFGKDAQEYVDRAIEAGFDHIDTAQVYRNEDSVGAAIRESGLKREEVYVTTKFGGGDVEKEFRTSLDKLQLAYVDLYLIHFPSAVPNGDYEAIWKSFEGFKKDGLAKSIGVSNFTISDFEKLLKVAKIKPAVNQIRLHPYNYAENRALLEFQAKHGIVTEAYSSLSPITKYPGGPVDAALEEPAKRLGITPAQVIFLWVRAKGAVVVTTTSKKDRLEEYLSVGDLPALTEEEITAIDDAGAKGPPQVSWLRPRTCIFIIVNLLILLRFIFRS